MSERTVPIDSLRLHPDAERVPMPDHSDLRTLRESLREVGQQDPIDVTEAGVILDGRTRWTLLRELGAQTIQARVQYVPDEQQTAFIVSRALTRRHLTLAQKRALNDLLREQVIEVRQPSPQVVSRGRPQPILVGYGQTERAEKLGVDRNTVTEWDRTALVVGIPTTRLPTHAIDKRGRLQPIKKPRPAEEGEPTVPVRATRPAPLRKARPIPSWSRYVSTWLRNSARPEDRDFLRRLDRELHAALDRNGIDCMAGEKNQ